MAKKKANLFELKLAFNDIVMREMGLDINDDNHIYNMDTNELFMIKDRYLKYMETEYEPISHNEIEFNLLENPRLMEILYGIWIQRRSASRGYEVTSYYLSNIRGSNKGFFVMTYSVNGESAETKSDVFINESLRIFNMITKINHTSHMYDFKRFDIEIPRKDQKQ